MSNKEGLNQQIQRLERELAVSRRGAQIEAAGNIYLAAMVTVQAKKIARLEIRLAKVRWPWWRRAAVKIRRALRRR